MLYFYYNNTNKIKTDKISQIFADFIKTVGSVLVIILQK